MLWPGVMLWVGGIRRASAATVWLCCARSQASSYDAECMLMNSLCQQPTTQCTWPWPLSCRRPHRLQLLTVNADSKHCPLRMWADATRKLRGRLAECWVTAALRTTGHVHKLCSATGSGAVESGGTTPLGTRPPPLSLCPRWLLRRLETQAGGLCHSAQPLQAACWPRLGAAWQRPAQPWDGC